MKKHELSEKDLDTMLKAYCNRNVTAFEVREKEHNIMKSRVLKIALCCTAALAILGAGIFTPQFFNTPDTPQIAETDSYVSKPKGFVITAAAAEQKPVELTNEDADFDEPECPSVELERLEFDNNQLARSFGQLVFAVKGRNVVSYDISCETGILDTCNLDLKDKREKGDKSIAISDYFQKGKTLKNIPYDIKNPNKYYSAWYPESDIIDKEIEKELGFKAGDKYEKTPEQLEKMFVYWEEHINSAEDMTKYFGDTVTITAHYNDGTSETAQAVITLDYKYNEENGGRYGYYRVRYK